MKHLIVYLAASVWIGTAVCPGQTSATAKKVEDQKLLAKTRLLYDTPWERGLISFDCDIEFDWKQHFIDVVGQIPPNAVPVVEQLQKMHLKLHADPGMAIVSRDSTSPSLAAGTTAATLENGFEAVTAAGVNAWMPYSQGVILPVGDTAYEFEKLESGYKLRLRGTGVTATLLLNADLWLTSGVVGAPQNMRFDTEFQTGTDGLLLRKVQTDTSTSSPTDASGKATFQFTYQNVSGFNIPNIIDITPSVPERWHYRLVHCNTQKATITKVLTINP